MTSFIVSVLLGCFVFGFCLTIQILNPFNFYSKALHGFGYDECTRGSQPFMVNVLELSWVPALLAAIYIAIPTTLPLVIPVAIVACAIPIALVGLGIYCLDEEERERWLATVPMGNQINDMVVKSQAAVDKQKNVAAEDLADIDETTDDIAPEDGPSLRQVIIDDIDTVPADSPAKIRTGDDASEPMESNGPEASEISNDVEAAHAPTQPTSDIGSSESVESSGPEQVETKPQ